MNKIVKIIGTTPPDRNGLQKIIVRVVKNEIIALKKYPYIKGYNRWERDDCIRYDSPAVTRYYHRRKMNDPIVGITRYDSSMT